MAVRFKATRRALFVFSANHVGKLKENINFPAARSPSIIITGRRNEENPIDILIEPLNLIVFDSSSMDLWPEFSPINSFLPCNRLPRLHLFQLSFLSLRGGIFEEKKVAGRNWFVGPPGRVSQTLHFSFLPLTIIFLPFLLTNSSLNNDIDSIPVPR